MVNHDKLKAIEYYQKIPAAKIDVNDNLFAYAQKQIAKIKEELFFEGKI